MPSLYYPHVMVELGPDTLIQRDITGAFSPCYENSVGIFFHRGARHGPERLTGVAPRTASHRHGPARPGHLFQHVPRQVARTSRAMTETADRMFPVNLKAL